MSAADTESGEAPSQFTDLHPPLWPRQLSGSPLWGRQSHSRGSTPKAQPPTPSPWGPGLQTRMPVAPTLQTAVLGSSPVAPTSCQVSTARSSPGKAVDKRLVFRARRLCHFCWLTLHFCHLQSQFLANSSLGACLLKSTYGAQQCPCWSPLGGATVVL